MKELYVDQENSYCISIYAKAFKNKFSKFIGIITVTIFMSILIYSMDLVILKFLLFQNSQFCKNAHSINLMQKI